MRKAVDTKAVGLVKVEIKEVDLGRATPVSKRMHPNR